MLLQSEIELKIKVAQFNTFLVILFSNNQVFLLTRKHNIAYIGNIKRKTVGEATTGIRVATAKQWRHCEQVSRRCRNKA